MKRWLALSGIVCTAGAILAGCSSSPSNILAKKPADVTMRIDDGTNFVGSAVNLQIGQGLDFATLTVSGYGTSNSNEFFTANVYIANSAVTDSDYEAELSSTAPGAGKCQISRGVDPAKATVATAGTITIHRHRGTHSMTGTIVTHDSTLAGTFSGPYSVECLVPPAQLGQPDPGPGILVMDSSFSTSFCRQFAALH